jgi:hypothetical protein
MNLKLLPAVAALALVGCVTAPVGPTRDAFPGRAKTFEQFQVDDGTCRDYAFGQIGGKSAADHANESAVGSAVVGTALGAAAGALIGGTASGAGVGAGIGLITGSAVGSSTAYGAYDSAQRRYDSAYYQCMYAKGNKVPMYGRYVQAASRPAPRPPSSYPPPPPNAPPPVNGSNPANGSAPPSVSMPVIADPPANVPPESIPPPNAPPPPR